VPPRRDPSPRLTVALDATPLLGVRSGVGRFCAGALGALGALGKHDELGAGWGLDVTAYAVTWRRRRQLPALLPPGVEARQRSMPARPLHLAWRRTNFPPVEWFVGSVAVVHGTNFVVPPSRRAQRVVTVHDLTTVRFPELCDPATLVFPELVRRAVAEGAWVHTPSQFVAEEVVAEFGADPARVRAVHHGVDPPTLSATSSGSLAGPRHERRLEASSGSSPESTERQPYLLAVGTIEPRKDYPGLVRAFDMVAGSRPDLRLVIAGAPGWGMEAFDRAVAGAHHGDRVVRDGYVDDARLARLLAGACALVFPSRYEGFGFPPLEAMAAGIPVVATAAGAVPEVVGDAARLVEPGDVDGLAGAIDAVLGEESLRRSMVEAGRRRVAEFTWDAAAQGLARLYADAMELR